MPFLAPLLGMFTGGIPWKLIGVAVLAAALGLLWWRNGVLADQRGHAMAQVTISEAKAQQNADAVAQLKADQAKALAAVDHVNEVAVVRQKQIVAIKEQIARAPTNDNCPAVDVAVDGLRKLFAPGP